MPTSTVWRRRLSDSVARAVSPPRPTDEHIERLSPEPHESEYNSSFDVFQRNRTYSNDHHLQGLGLSHTTISEDLYAHPDHLYLDQNGGAHIGAKIRTSAHSSRLQKHHSKENRNTERRSATYAWHSEKGKGHTRSGSTIDDLANIAIATSPQFSHASPVHYFNGSPGAQGPTRPSTSYVNGYFDTFDRPTKRVKSEKLYAMEWSPNGERPRSSYAQHSVITQEEAELLLGLRNGFTSFMPVAAPPQPSESIQGVADTAPELDNTLKSAAPPASATPVTLLEPTGIEEDMEMKDIETSTREETDSPSLQAHNELQKAISDNMKDKLEPGNDGNTLPTSERDEPVNPPITVGTGTAEEEIENTLPRPVKKQRKIKPDVQAEVCAGCLRLQLESHDEDSTIFWISCEACKGWFHSACAGFKDKLEARAVDKFICKDCEPAHGQSTFVRKSSRARTAIDYAGLNEGVVKSSDDTSMHHYVPKFKDGSISWLPDDFARIRPELMTADFWENMDGMKRPFVVPACWNPRFGERASDEEELESDGETNAAENNSQCFNSQREEVPLPQSGVTELETIELEAFEEAIDVDQDYLDMVMPRHLTVRKVAELYGPNEPVPVIDVKSQETKGAFTLEQWANYYEEPGDKPIRNVISLEVSNSRLGRLIRRPKVVRDIDLEDQVWDADLRKASNKRPVAFYCLMSVADSYTDFHIDFGGSSVYYHILKGVKTFFFIPPEDKYLKKYEEWCNSDTQNETWLGDVCGGNVRRVDLHEGDTAFIPAGWIHSVWTPEDSLVVGGNFLTRYDYELQLKVANIEKVTRVPQKFRYPFFQKVMWYTLIKYLEDDPVPEEVFRDFQQDADFVYLRANPIWYDVEFANAAESAEAGFNARTYSKSELAGLPALRDYLYRTARIYADLPVPDINKRQIDAVKASIPKAHGDPMQLIKRFAVWCAWKTGNIPVPEWVHSDLGLQAEVDRKEKSKKLEIFKVPPERVSARQSSRAAATPPVEDQATTPIPSPLNPDIDEGSVKKQRSGSKGTVLRVACEPCRKRRIKCRHKEDLSLESAQQTLERPRSYSNISVDIAKLARASPVFGGNERPPSTEAAPTEFGGTSDLAQAALASMQSQVSESNSTSVNGATPGSAKKGRSKACEECRKSKRRCVHDEYGRVDPAKAAEPSKPRGSGTSKRPARLSDEMSHKRVKSENDTDAIMSDAAMLGDDDSMIDPALLDAYQPMDFLHSQGEYGVNHDYSGAFEEQQDSTNMMHNNTGSVADDTLLIDPALTAVVDSLPRFTDGGEDLYASASQVDVSPVKISAPEITPDHDISYSPITVDGGMTESIEKPCVKIEGSEHEIPGSRRSSRYSQNSERPDPESRRSYSRSQTKVLNDERRGSSMTSPRQEVMSLKSRRSSSNTSGTTHQAAGIHNGLLPKESQETSVRPGSRGSTEGSDIDADERFARELQAAENGLRRRASVRA